MLFKTYALYGTISPFARTDIMIPLELISTCTGGSMTSVRQYWLMDIPGVPVAAPPPGKRSCMTTST